MAITRHRPPGSKHRRHVLYLCAACLTPVAFILLFVFLRTNTSGLRPSSLDDIGDKHAPYRLLRPDVGTSWSPQGPNLGYAIGDWEYDVARDGENFGLSDEQCDAAFPDYYHEIDRAVAWRADQNLSNIESDQLSTSWREELVRIMIYDRKLHIIDSHWAKHGYDIPRGLALLYQIHRAIVAYQGPLPNIEFTIALGDWPGDPDGKWPVWVLCRNKEESNKWVVPDFGYWSWGLDPIGDYTQVRNDIAENQVHWAEKIKKAVWRGSTNTNGIRKDLIQASQDQSWSDIHAMKWINMAHMDEESYKRSLTMADHCNYQFVVHTEGHTYSGRGKYLLNCESVSIVHTPDWIEPHTHLMVEAGPEQNIVKVERNFTDLGRKMIHYVKQQEDSEAIAKRSTAVFRDRYLSPAAQACYWRRLFKAWATVSFEPQLYRTIRDDLGKVRRKSRGVPFETFVASLVLPGKKG